MLISEYRDLCRKTKLIFSLNKYLPAIIAILCTIVAVTLTLLNLANPSIRYPIMVFGILGYFASSVILLIMVKKNSLCEVENALKSNMYSKEEIESILSIRVDLLRSGVLDKEGCQFIKSVLMSQDDQDRLLIIKGLSDINRSTVLECLRDK